MAANFTTMINQRLRAPHLIGLREYWVLPKTLTDARPIIRKFVELNDGLEKHWDTVEDLVKRLEAEGQPYLEEHGELLNMDDRNMELALKKKKGEKLAQAQAKTRAVKAAPPPKKKAAPEPIEEESEGEESDEELKRMEEEVLAMEREVKEKEKRRKRASVEARMAKARKALQDARDEPAEEEKK
jgi:hypothetical protein